MQSVVFHVGSRFAAVAPEREKPNGKSAILQFFFE